MANRDVIKPELYDFTDASQIEKYGKYLVGMTFQDVLDLDILPEGVEEGSNYGDKNYKGGMGTLIEERFYGYKANSDDKPDFYEAGVELKTTPYDIKRNGDLSAGERLVLTMIPYDREVTDNFYDSHCWTKANNIMLIYYHRDKTLDSKYDQHIEYATLFSPPKEDLKIIEDDYKKIVGYIKQGRADELSESLTLYLGACTKGSTAKKSWVSQYYNPDKLAKKRAFCFKRSYMDYVLHNYIMPGQQADDSDSIIGSVTDQVFTLEDYVVSVIDTYKGKTDKELCELFDMKYTGNKAQWTTLVYRMLGIKGNDAKEFKKGGISVRVVREEAGGNKIKEHLSLSTIDFMELSEENWEDSWLLHYFTETRFFFVVFEKQDGCCVLKGSTFWNMPESDIEGELYRCWKETQYAINNGVEFRISGNRVFNNLPGGADNAIAHVRPHANKSAYKLKCGYEKGDIKKDAKRLPDDQYMTIQSFWLNRDYVLQILKSTGL